MLPNVDLSDLHFKEGVNYNVLKSIMDTTPDEKLHDVIKERYNELVPLTYHNRGYDCIYQLPIKSRLWNRKS